MRFEKVIKDREALIRNALNCDVDVVEVDGKLDAVTIRRDGSCIRIASSDYSGLQVMTPAAPKTEERYRIVSTDPDISVAEDFESEYEANSKISKIDRRFNLDDGVLTVEKFDAVIEE